MVIALMLSHGNTGGLVGWFSRTKRAAQMHPSRFGRSFVYAAAGVTANTILKSKLWYTNQWNAEVSREEIYDKHADHKL